jgi:hypothetical protein
MKRWVEQLVSYWKPLAIRLFTKWRELRGRAREAAQSLLSSDEMRAHTKRFLLIRWYRHRNQILRVLSTLVLLVLITFLKRHWVALDEHLSGLEKTVIPDLAIGIGAAISGIIAIAFTLSLFAIQQMADKATPQPCARIHVIPFLLSFIGLSLVGPRGVSLSH